MNAPKRLLEDHSCSPELRAWLAHAPAPSEMAPSVATRLAAYSARLAAGGLATGTLLPAGAEAAQIAIDTTASGAAQSTLGAKLTLLFTSATLGAKVAVVSTAFSSMVGLGYLASAPLFTAEAPGHVAVRGSGTTGAAVPSSRARVLAPPVSSASVRVGHEEQANVPLLASPTPRLSNSFGMRKTSPAAVAQELNGGLSGEARLLEAARASLSSSPAQALALTEEHARIYPLGQLGAERELIAIDALLRLGRRGEAWAWAKPRLEDAPDGLYAKRLRRLFGAEEP